MNIGGLLNALLLSLLDPFSFQLLMALFMFSRYRKAKRAGTLVGEITEEQERMITSFSYAFVVLPLLFTLLSAFLVGYLGQVAYYCHLCSISVFLLYVGRFDVFPKSQKRAFLIFNILLLALSAFGFFSWSVRVFSLRYFLGFLIPIVAIVCMLCGYFLPWCKRRGNGWRAFIAFGWIVYVPLVLLIIVIAIGYFAINLFFGDKPSSPKKGKRWEVTENGVSYIIEETPNGTYFDDCGNEWLTNDEGITFYRK